MVVVCKAILVFSLSQGQAEQKLETNGQHRSKTPRSIFFIKDNYFHALPVSFCEKYLSFRIFGAAFFGTPGTPYILHPE